jgi:hypothetical protein
MEAYIGYVATVLRSIYPFFVWSQQMLPNEGTMSGNMKSIIMVLKCTLKGIWLQIYSAGKLLITIPLAVVFGQYKHLRTGPSLWTIFGQTLNKYHRATTIFTIYGSSRLLIPKLKLKLSSSLFKSVEDIKENSQWALNSISKAALKNALVIRLFVGVSVSFLKERTSKVIR